MEFYIRPAAPKDASDINALRRMPGVFENITGIPSEPLKLTESFLSSIDPNSHQFVAVKPLPEGKELVIGTAVLSVSPRPRMRHSGSLGIMIHKDYQDQGVGTALMNTLLDLADNWLMLIRVELTVYEDNYGAIHLYEKLGFEKEGLNRMAAIRNGEYVNQFTMARIHPGMK